MAIHAVCNAQHEQLGPKAMMPIVNSATAVDNLNWSQAGGAGEPCPVADLGGVSPVPVQKWEGKPSPGAGVASKGQAQSRCRCGSGAHRSSDG
jgi:hypothetical protein